MGLVSFDLRMSLTEVMKRERDNLLTRRQFTSVLATLATGRLRAGARVRVALQLFSLRKQCEEDLEGTLAYVREMGFEGVELAGYYGRTAAQVKGLLGKHSLPCCGSHTPLPELTGDRLKTTIEDNRMLGNRNLILPGLPKEYEGSVASWKAAAELLNEIAERLRPAGMRIGYHNHDIEFRFVDGVLPWAVLYEHTRPEVILQLDTGNARIGGADPTALIRQYPGRAVTVHLKDYLPGRADPVLGSSDFDWKQFLRTCRSRGATEWYIIEHDSSRREEAKTCLDRLQEFRAGIE
jgi:sugar phosphate isomerase/epimerase